MRYLLDTIRNLLIALCLCGMWLTPSSAVSAQTDASSSSPEKLSAEIIRAARTLDGARASALFNFRQSFIEGIRQTPGGADMLKNLPELVAFAQEAGETAFLREFDDRSGPAIETSARQFYASHFTPVELQEMVAFYHSPAAREYLEEMVDWFANPVAPNQPPTATQSVVTYGATTVGRKEIALTPELFASVARMTMHTAAESLPAVQAAVIEAMASYRKSHPIKSPADR